MRRFLNNAIDKNNDIAVALSRKSHYSPDPATGH